MKRICVIGLGQYGAQLSLTLSKMGCEVLAIDVDESRVKYVQDNVSSAVICDAKDFSALESVISAEFDEGIICLAENLESSILCALHLQKIGVKRVRAKASTQDHAAILRAIGVADVIFPEQEAAMRKAQQILHPELLEMFLLSEEYRIAELNIPASFQGQSLIELGLRRKYHVYVIGVRPEGEKLQPMPPPDYELPAGTMIVIGRTKDISRLYEE